MNQIKTRANPNHNKKTGPSGLDNGVHYIDFAEHRQEVISVLTYEGVIALLAFRLPVFFMLDGFLFVGCLCLLVKRFGTRSHSTAPGTPFSSERLDIAKPTEEMPTTDFRINKPREDRPVEEGEIVIEGTWKAMPPIPDRMAILVRRGNTYWPQRSRHFHTHPNGTWDCRLNEESDNGKPLDVIVQVVRLGEQGQLWLELHEQAIKDHQLWVGLDLPVFPASIPIDDLVTIRVVPKRTA